MQQRIVEDEKLVVAPVVCRISDRDVGDSSLMSLTLYKTRKVGRSEPKWGDVVIFLLKTESPMVSMYFHGS